MNRMMDLRQYWSTAPVDFQEGDKVAVKVVAVLGGCSVERTWGTCTVCGAEGWAWQGVDHEPGCVHEEHEVEGKVYTLVADWAAYWGLTSQTDEEVAESGDKISEAAARALFPSIASRCARYCRICRSSWLIQAPCEIGFALCAALTETSRMNGGT